MAVHIVHNSIFLDASDETKKTYEEIIAGNEPKTQAHLYNLLDWLQLVSRREGFQSIPPELLSQEYTLGRSGLSPVISTWAKEQFPHSQYVTHLTIIDAQSNVHFILFYH